MSGETPTAFCSGCGARVPDVWGQVHAYMLSDPGCWQLYGEVTARNLGLAERRLAMDCYAAQHPGGAQHDPRQRQSVAVHLTALCLHVEERLPAALLMARLNRMSRTALPLLGASEWPLLSPPDRMGKLTVAEVHAANTQECAGRMEDWAGAVWWVWSEQHETVRGWARLVLAAR